MAREMNISVKHGCTLQSGKIFSINESVPRNTTYAEIIAGIAAGTYTKKSLADKTYSGQIREQVGFPVLAELSFQVVDNELSFSVPASVIETWPNAAATFFYDVQETDTVTSIVSSKVEGRITVVPYITEDI